MSEFPSSTPRDLQPPFFVDPILVAVTIGLVALSIVMVYSTTGVMSQEKFGDPYYYVKRQAVAAGIGLVLMMVCSRVPAQVLRLVSPYFYVVALALLVLTLIPGLGDRAGGAQRWIVIGPLRFQPGEFVKLFFTIFAAGFYTRHEDRLRSFSQGVMKPLFLVGIVSLLFLSQPDFGSTVVLLIVTLGMGMVCGVRPWHFFLCGIGCLVPLTAVIVSSPYRMARVANFLSPFSDPAGRGYQLIQSLIALGSGQLTGRGIGGSQQKLFFLPAAHTDFIFSVIGEELGFVGCVTVLVLFLIFFWRGIRLAERSADDTFASALILGLTMIVAVPALLNAGVVTGLLPTKGMVLPLVGYGGSSLVACLVGIGLLLGVARTARPQS